MKFFQKITLVISLFVLGQSKLYAQFTPESGFWWNPDEPGTGYSVEIQDNFMFVAFYVYDELGNPFWYSAGTTLSGDDGNTLFDTELNLSINGTCIDCGFTQSTTLVGERGPVTIEFITETTATIQFQNQVKNIERFNFALGDQVDTMLGKWNLVFDLADEGLELPYFGEVLIFNDTLILDGVKTAEGCRPDNSLEGVCSNFSLQTHLALAEYDPQDNIMFVLVDDTADFYLLYYLIPGLNQLDGEVEFFSKSTGNTNIFYPARAFRSASRTFVETGQGPSQSSDVKSQNATGSVLGLASRINEDLSKRALSTFSKAEQAKILRRQTIVKTMIAKVEKSKNQSE